MRARLEYLVALFGHARARHLLVACGLLIGLVLASATTWFVLELRQQDIADSERELKNLSLILAEETDRSFQAAELVQRGLIDHMREIGIDSPEKFERQMTSVEAHLNLKDRIAGLPNVDALALIDLHGRLLNVSRFWPARNIDVSDRDFFKALTSDASLTSYISEPVLNRTNGTWTILFAHKITAPDGTLLGIVNTGIQLAYFEGLFARIALDAGASFDLYRRDGMLLARYPHAESRIGQPFGGTANFNRLLAVLDTGFFRLTSTMDGKDRLVAPHGVAHYPLVIAVTDTVESVLGHWRSEARVIGATTVLLELVIAGIIVLGVRHLRSYERVDAANAAKAAAETAQARAESELIVAREREHAARALQTQGQRFGTALNNMQQGLTMFDDAGRLLLVNRRFCEFSGVPMDALTPGISHADVVKLAVATGKVRLEDLDELRRLRQEMADQNSPATFIWERTDGLTFTVTHQPMANGWLATYEDITERRAAELRIAHLAHHDALTNLPNRVQLRETLEHAMAFARRGHLLALHCLDLDQFKAVNDTLGHPVGDGLLQEVAQRLRDGLRETDTVARLGGDEFAIVQTEIESPIDATGLASRLVELIEAPFEIAGHQIVIGTSIGIAFAPQDGLDADQLLKCADLALYRAKADGRGVYRLFQAEMDAAMQARRILELDLRQALHAGQLEVFYQPLIDVRASRVAGCEALLRWRHPTKGLVAPDQFIHLAEETGLIVPIGEWVLRQACATAAEWRDGQKVAVNLSPVQFKSRNLVATVVAALQESGLHPSRLELEITETVMLQDTDATLATLHQLRDQGIHIAMDDFGTGYSSLSYLRRFPFDRIKIDQSFVRGLGKRADCIAIVRAVTALGGDLGMGITAEGVETREQLDTLARAGCTEIQGYLFSPAVPGSAIPALLRTISDSLRAGTVDAELEHIA